MFSSCEKVIDFPLTNTAPEPIIEAQIKNPSATATLKLSMSQNYYSTEPCQMITNASAWLTWGDTNRIELEEINPGYYSATNPGIHENETYFLNLEMDGKSYQAESYMPFHTTIDSVYYIYSSKTLFAPEGFRVWAIFNDPPEKGNYFRLQLFVNNVCVTNGVIYLWCDDETNGKTVQYIFYQNALNSSDRFRVELWAIDKESYEYYRELQGVISNNNGTQLAAPANPVNNFSDNVLGNFSAISVYSTREFQIHDN